MTQTTTPSRSFHGTLARGLMPANLPGIMTMFALWRQRRALAQLSDAQLDDMGLSRTEARREAARAAWDVPTHWRG